MVPASGEGPGPLPTTHLPKVKPLRQDHLPGCGAHSLPTLPARSCGHRHGRVSVAFLRDRSQAGQQRERVVAERGRQIALEPWPCRGRGGSAGPCCGPCGLLGEGLALLHTLSSYGASPLPGQDVPHVGLGVPRAPSDPTYLYINAWVSSGSPGLCPCRVGL